MEIKILGTGCTKCKALEKMVNDVVSKNNINATVIKVEDFKEIVKYTMITPTLIVDDVVKLRGNLPSIHELTKILYNEN